MKPLARAKDAFLSWLYVRGPYMRPGLRYLEVNFLLGRIPGLRNLHPWMDPAKNSMSYMPIKVNAPVGQAVNEVLPPQVVHEFIDQAEHHVIMNTCGCRVAFECKNHDNSVGCLFMGETALRMPEKLSRRVTREEAHAHVDRAVENGLVPMVGKVRVDNFIFLTPDKSQLLSVCFCCHCCCMMGYLKHLAPEHMDEVMVPLEGAEVRVDEAVCQGCGTCVETCIFEAIEIRDGKAVHSTRCRACGRCVRYCPNNAVELTVTGSDFVEKAMERIGAYVKVK